ncbi:type II secretion system minor pseudopilin GspI [Geobacter argillaceus]|uniref:Type II secretion system protein I n=1 Tax=Geobacter argillaceus TaxID=345631 RepID=A0A562WS88_9BACT|nr:type II secretion system minor pseudopilin GspI [Geobacter argillaceus]TWJ33468.1 general secretion pathway protein I [Geobacter argillaceus]
MNRGTWTGARGFTLLEVLIALAIMAGVVTTVISVFNQHLSVVSRDKEETIALLLARSKIDEPGFRDLPAGSKGTFAPQWPLIAWETATAPTELPGVSRLTLTVTWDGTRRKLSLVQYVAKL